MCSQIVDLERIYRKYKNDHDFLLVITSDKPSMMSVPGFENVSMGNRRKQTAKALWEHEITMPTALDRNRRVEKDYDVFPMRAFVIEDGKIMFDSFSVLTTAHLPTALAKQLK